MNRRWTEPWRWWPTCVSAARGTGCRPGQTLRPYLIEEAHELAAALGSGEPAAIREEVADLLLHLAWQLVLGAGDGGIYPGRDRGRPGGQDASPPPAPLRAGRAGALGDPQGPGTARRARGARRTAGSTLPDFLLAYRLQERAAGVGFDWPDTRGPLQKVAEELAEVEAETRHRHRGPRGALTDEIGDLLFAVVNLARKAGVQPGTALDRANAKFRRRFESIETIAAERGVVLGNATLEELDVIWDEVKEVEKREARSEKRGA